MLQPSSSYVNVAEQEPKVSKDGVLGVEEQVLKVLLFIDPQPEQFYRFGKVQRTNLHARAACRIKRPEFLWTAAGGTPRIRSFKGGEFVIEVG